MKHLVLLLAFLVACDEDKPDTPAVAHAKEACKQLLKHIVTISPEGSGKNAEEIVAALPIEDIQACVATDPQVRECMAVATNIATVKSCPGVIACSKLATTARDTARKKANQLAGSPALDKPFEDVRAKCLAGDEHAADSLRTE